MRYYHDWEFYEDGKTIHPVSVGIVAEDDRELYLEFDFDWSRVPAGHFLWENVYPHLQYDDAPDHPGIQNQVRRFITQNGTEFDNELWGYYSSYDHVCLAQLFGRMVDMPEGVPWYTQDIQQLKKMLHNEGWEYEFPKQSGTAHHALEDARWTKAAYDDIMKFARGDDW